MRSLTLNIVIAGMEDRIFVLILGYRMLMATSLPGVQHGAARHHQADRERQAEADPPGGEVRVSRQTPPSFCLGYFGFITWVHMSESRVEFNASS